jgi:hypothetical protein
VRINVRSTLDCTTLHIGSLLRRAEGGSSLQDEEPVMFENRRLKGMPKVPDLSDCNIVQGRAREMRKNGKNEPTLQYVLNDDVLM